MRQMKPIDRIALIITVTTATILLVIVIGPLVTGVRLSEAKAGLVAGLIGSFIAIITTYVGSKLKTQSEEEEKDRKP